MDPQDSRSVSPWAWGFRPGDAVRVVDGTFAGMAGEVLSHEQAQERLRGLGQPTSRPATELLWVLLDLFHRPVPVPFNPDQIRHAEPEDHP